MFLVQEKPSIPSKAYQVADCLYEFIEVASFLMLVARNISLNDSPRYLF
jgi:hypothetical protein